MTILQIEIKREIDSDRHVIVRCNSRSAQRELVGTTPVRFEAQLIDKGALGPARTLNETVKTLLSDLYGVSTGGVGKFSPHQAFAIGKFLAGLLPDDAISADTDYHEVQIITRDPLAAGLPWPLMLHRGGADLITNGTPVRICPDLPIHKKAGFLLGTQVEILPVIPGQIPFFPDTEGDAHETELRAAFGSSVLDRVRTVDQLLSALKNPQPKIIYFYGHGTLASGSFELQLEGGGLEASKFADWLSTQPGATSALELLYLNACFSGASDLFGAPLTIGKYSRALVCNRTTALQEPARRQALKFLQSILVEDRSPQEAVLDIVRLARSERAPEGAGESEPWWLTPMLVSTYEEWGVVLPDRYDGMIAEWETLQLDRAEQSDCFRHNVNRIRNNKQESPVSLILWVGSEDDGVASLSERFYDDLLELANSQTFPVRRARNVHIGLPLEALTSEQAEKRDLFIYNALTAAIRNDLKGFESVEEMRNRCRGKLVDDGELAKALWNAAAPAGGLVLLRHAPIALPENDDNHSDYIKNLLISYGFIIETFIAPYFLKRSIERRCSLMIFIPINSIWDEKFEFLAGLKTSNAFYTTLIEPPLSNITGGLVQTFLSKFGSMALQAERKSISEKIIMETGGLYEPTRTALTNPRLYMR